MHALDSALIVGSDGAVALSLRGSQLAAFDIRAARVEVTDLPHPGRLVAVDEHVFAVVGDAPGSPVSVRGFERPGHPLVCARVVDEALIPVEGDPGSLRDLPALMVLEVSAVLLRIDGVHGCAGCVSRCRTGRPTPSPCRTRSPARMGGMPSCAGTASVPSW